MKRRLIKILGCIFLVNAMSTSCLWAANNTLKDALSQFQSGYYNEALKLLKSAPKKEQRFLENIYWQSQCHYKLQQFDKATEGFEQVLQGDSRGKKYPDAAYLLGQSFYAIQEFRKALPSFERSAAQGYKAGPSLYYVGYIQNMLEREDEAIKTFEKILALPTEDDEDMRQSAAFQMGEAYYELAQRMKDKKKQKEMFLQKAVPTYEKTISFDEANVLSRQATGRIDAIQKKLGIKSDIPRTKSGAAIPKKAWVVRFTEDLKYDSNIINEPDGRIVKVSNTGTPFLKTGIFGKYEFIFANWIAVTPELSFDWTFHTRRGDSSVYSNDNTNTNPAVRGRLDHTVAGRPAAGLAEVEYAFSSRDYLGRFRQMYYTRSWNFIAGERLELLKVGSTTAKFNLKLAENSNQNLNFVAPAVNLSQNWLTFQRYMLNTSLTAEWQLANNIFYDQRSLQLNTSYSMPSLFWNTNVDFSFSLRIIDTINQGLTRGYEKNITPSVTFTKNIDAAGHFAVNLNYSYTEQMSKDEAAYAYSKHVVGLGAQVTF